MSASSLWLGPSAPFPSRVSGTARPQTGGPRGPNCRESARLPLVGRLAAVILISAATGVSTPRTAADRLEALSRVLRSRPVWSATYAQEYLPAGMTVGERDRGTVWVAWPDRAHFRSGEPVVRFMGMEGRRVRLLDLDVPSCDEHRMNDDEWARIPLAAVLDPQGAIDRFTILEFGSRGFALVPRQPGGVARVEVELGEDSLPSSVVIIDPQGAKNSLDFEGWSAAESPPGGLWLPEPPATVDCLTEPGPREGAW